jgi:hypothetical protein
VISQGLSSRSGDVELTGSPKWFGDVRGNHGEVPAQCELEREIRARDPRADSLARDDTPVEMVARPAVDERSTSMYSPRRSSRRASRRSGSRRQQKDDAPRPAAGQ